jgi:hypothetical protein
MWGCVIQMDVLSASPLRIKVEFECKLSAAQCFAAKPPEISEIRVAFRLRMASVMTRLRP